MSGGFAESDAEEAALGWLETLGYRSGTDRKSQLGSMVASAATQDTTTQSCKAGCIVR